MSYGKIIYIFDQVRALENHRRLTRLLPTIDKTIKRLTEKTISMTHEELYEGFTQEQIER